MSLSSETITKVQGIVKEENRDLALESLFSTMLYYMSVNKEPTEKREKEDKLTNAKLKVCMNEILISNKTNNNNLVNTRRRIKVQVYTKA